METMQFCIVKDVFRAVGGRFDVHTSECKHKVLESHVMICSYA